MSLVVCTNERFKNEREELYKNLKLDTKILKVIKTNEEVRDSKNFSAVLLKKNNRSIKKDNVGV